MACRLECNDRPTAESSLVRAFPQPQSNDRCLRYTHVPNCACRGRTGKLGDVPGGGRKCERRIRKVISLRSFRRRRHYENAARIEHALPDLYRQIDTQDLFSLKERPHRHGELRRYLGSVSQRDAYQNSSQSRIHRIDLEARDGVEGHRRRVFLDSIGKDNHRSTQRYVLLGKTILQGGEC